MTKAELAALLDGVQYDDIYHASERIEQHKEAAKAAGLVIIHGYSDDLIEFRGAIDDELKACNGTTAYLHRGGVLPDPTTEDCERCAKHWLALQAQCVKVDCLWDEADDYWWVIRANGIPYASFDIMDDDDKFCRGIVIDVNDLPVIDLD